jgi:2-iminobutanoate/2-iminopropanoate deaminase
MKLAVGGTKPAGPYSPGIIAEGRFVFISGQGPFEDGKRVEGSVAEEARATLNNVARVLESAGASAADVVRCNVYLADLADFAEMNAVYAEFFPDPKPARTTVGTALLFGMKIEIDCVARVPD